jgi:hypothetical protein
MEPKPTRTVRVVFDVDMTSKPTRIPGERRLGPNPPTPAPADDGPRTESQASLTPSMPTDHAPHHDQRRELSATSVSAERGPYPRAIGSSNPPVCTPRANRSSNSAAAARNFSTLANLMSS